MKTLRFLGLNALVPLPLYVLWLGCYLAHPLSPRDWQFFPLCFTSFCAFAASVPLALLCIDKAYDTHTLS